ncbi:MAG TPA: indole-3-glycerol phosphate synthase TrpC [Trueperaceae bacterium]
MSTEAARSLPAALTGLAPLRAEALDAVPGVLGRIVRERAADYAQGAAADWLDRSVQAAGAAQGRSGRDAFVTALRRAGTEPLNVIAEVKRSSPSQGDIAPLEPVDAARQYVAGGAAAISVLTEKRHFGGELAHLAAVAADRERWPRRVPLLRKDFTVHPAQLVEAAAAGADAVLVIVAVTGGATRDYVAAAHALGLAALVEVHDDRELEVALAAGAEVIGVNNRDLTTLAVDLGNAPRLLAAARASGFAGVLVAESGYGTREDLESVQGLADAVLVGTSLAASGDLAGALRRLTGR